MATWKFSCCFYCRKSVFVKIENWASATVKPIITFRYKNLKSNKRIKPYEMYTKKKKIWEQLGLSLKRITLWPTEQHLLRYLCNTINVSVILSVLTIICFLIIIHSSCSRVSIITTKYYLCLLKIDVVEIRLHLIHTRNLLYRSRWYIFWFLAKNELKRLNIVTMYIEFYLVV